jgi:hypothetical protein
LTGPRRFFGAGAAFTFFCWGAFSFGFFFAFFFGFFLAGFGASAASRAARTSSSFARNDSRPSFSTRSR